jgi:transcriptional regulator with XRE-family HTH domain
MNALGEAIRALISRHGLTGAQLGEEIGLSATSVSRIIQGHAKPKQVTLSRLMKRLCVNPEDQQLILRAFTGVAVPATEEPVSGDPRNTVAERERIERWLEARTQAITFKDAVARELEKAGIAYRRDVCDGIASADFLIEQGKVAIAIECKFNVGRDFDKTLGIARLLKELLHCDRVFVVVPFIGAFADAAMSGPTPVLVCTPADLAAQIKREVSS